jgi:quinol monooxygenase YgiN
MYVATLRFSVPPEKKADAIAVLRSLCSQADAMPGCQLCRLYDNVGLDDGDDELLLIERWTTKGNMEKHILSPVFQQLIEILDFASAPPELMFHRIAATAGIELVEDLCRNKRN